jgi:hypothetical protein
VLIFNSGGEVSSNVEREGGRERERERKREKIY